ncbi:receptor-like protein kinase FERONIA [Cornus florida]|uniref:receptor-like protein kinase FERONIA n=1 Tax=Cornus florida TaxID=4283 RepID=UPI00289FBE00|nr:receptor-like protein kinase FERONIA [Cornus florida]
MKNIINTNSYLKNLVMIIISPLYLIFLLTSSLILIPCNSQPFTYNPSVNIALDCGSSEEHTSPDGRYWFGETSLYLSPLEQKPNKSIAPSVSAHVPYSTAHISLSDFSYVFPVTARQNFIRLHFYASQYPNFDPSKAFFSVKANQFTLLSNFSAFLTATSLGSYFIVKEFCINVGDQDHTLNITFTPSLIPLDAYAFINGIEIVSMPTNLYYTSAEAQDGITFVGHEQTPIRIEKSTFLETVHRLNVGGSDISPVNDTGMFRSWLKDDDYVSNIGALPVNNSFEVLFTKVPSYTAPAEVYMSARSMGNNKTVNKKYNLTWNLPVDSGFTYLVRLHFCEFQVEVTKQSDREFTIFIADKTAEPQADVIVWAGRNHVPFCRNYAVMMVSQGRDQKKQNLSIALHPNPESTTVYPDAILNGIEVFKLSDYSVTPARHNPVPVPQPRRTTLVAAAVVGGVLSGVATLSLLGFLIFRQRRRVKESGSSHGRRAACWGSISYLATKNDKMGGSLLPSDSCRYFTFAEIKAATNNFDNAFIIGRGGFGDVYRGYINCRATPVAIKRLKQGSQQGAHEFKTEIEMLSQLRHLHLVSLIGYCNEKHEMILVYDYMSNGTLSDHLYGTNNPPLPWKQRLEICIGAGRGLHYLHACAKHRVIHRDVKTTNILLDDKWVAKVSDFGLSKINPTDASNTHISTAVKGSFGYLDPEYYQRQQLTEKSDVYSFGVVLLEVLSGRAPLNKALEIDQVSLVLWARKCYQNGTLDQIIDPHLIGNIEPECLKKFTEIAVRCLHDEGIKRPSMNEVVWTLEFALQLQVSEKDGIKIDGGMSFTTNRFDKVSSADVFSEIMKPCGR